MDTTRTTSPAPAKLGLGCVALGQGYGTAHPTTRPSDEDGRGLLGAAAALGLRMLDTAPAYGDSEARLGSLRPPKASFDFVSKVSWASSGAAEPSVKASLEALRVPALYGLLAHSADELLDAARGPARFAELERLRDEGRVQRIGVSVYSPDEARRLLDSFASLDLIQLPISALDRRFEDSGLLAELAAEGVEIHARSLLLQGALAMEPEALPAALDGLRSAVRRFRAQAAAVGLTALGAAIGYVCSRPEIRVALIGATTTVELTACVEASRTVLDPADFPADASDLGAWIDPRAWRGGAS